MMMDSMIKEQENDTANTRCLYGDNDNDATAADKVRLGIYLAYHKIAYCIR